MMAGNRDVPFGVISKGFTAVCNSKWPETELFFQKWENRTAIITAGESSPIKAVEKKTDSLCLVTWKSALCGVAPIALWPPE